jgi:type I restriction enzyme S subunit
MSFESFKIKELCQFKYGKGLPERERIPGDYPVFGSAGIIGTHNEYLLKAPGIIIGRKGTVGSVNWTDKDFYPIDTAYYIVEEKEKVDLKYLYYRLLLAGLETMNNDAAVPGLNRTAALNHRITIPKEIAIQCKIASSLSFYDELIENNLKRIRLFQEMAQMIFNEWFAKVDCLPGGWVEQYLGSLVGWGEENQDRTFSEPAYVIRGTDIDELPNGKLDKVPFRYHKKSNLASRKLQDGDIVFEVSGGSHYEGVAKTLLVTDELLSQFDGHVICASFCKLLRPASRNFSNFTFLFLRFLRAIGGTEVFEIRSASNIVNYNWTAFLKFQKVKLPDEKTLEQFNKIIEPIYKQIYNLGHQNRLLKEARDILLPRLMTGIIET